MYGKYTVEVRKLRIQLIRTNLYEIRKKKNRDNRAIGKIFVFYTGTYIFFGVPEPIIKKLLMEYSKITKSLKSKHKVHDIVGPPHAASK